VNHSMPVMKIDLNDWLREDFIRIFKSIYFVLVALKFIFLNLLTCALEIFWENVNSPTGILPTVVSPMTICLLRRFAYCRFDYCRFAY